MSKITEDKENNSPHENMSKSISNKNDEDLLQQSTLFRCYSQELEEIERYQNLRSQQEGRKIGLERAIAGWAIHHRSEWRRRHFSS